VFVIEGKYSNFAYSGYSSSVLLKLNEDCLVIIRLPQIVPDVPSVRWLLEITNNAVVI
jgi:hypothetical protein